jgi:hypothetical protein
MASRADLIMAQVRGELSQIYRKKKDEGSVIDDVTAGILGYQTGQEAMYALEGAVKDFRTDYLKGKFDSDSLRGKMGERIYGKNVELKDLTPEQRALAKGKNDTLNINPRLSSNVDTISLFAPKESLVAPVKPRYEFDEEEPTMLGNMDTREQPVKPEYSVPSEPENMAGEFILPVDEVNIDLIDVASKMYLDNTLDTTMTNGSMLNPVFAESTGYNYSNVNLKDIPGVDYDLEAIKATQAAAGVTRFFTGGDMSDVKPKQDEIANEAINKLTTG